MPLRRLSLALGIAAALPGAAVADRPRALSVEQAGVAAAAPDTQAFAITATLSNEAGRYRIGDPVALTVRLDRDAHLLVLNVDEAGTVTVLFPNDYNPDSFVAGGVDHAMPGPGARIVVAGPPGLELIKVIASASPIDLDRMADFVPAGPFRTSRPGTARSLARALSVEAVVAAPAAEAPADVAAPETPPAAAPAPPGAPGMPERWGEVVLRLETVAAENGWLRRDNAPEDRARTQTRTAGAAPATGQRPRPDGAALRIRATGPIQPAPRSAALAWLERPATGAAVRPRTPRQEAAAPVLAFQQLEQLPPALSHVVAAQPAGPEQPR